MELSKFNKGVFLVTVLGIVYNPKTEKILIGKREKDPYVKKLGWCFPGGRPAYEKDLEYYLEKEIAKKTNVKIKDCKAIFAKTYPEERKILSIYYLCNYASGKAKPKDKFVEVKWVKPTEVKKYFTTSLHPTLFKFLRGLEK